MQSSVPGKDKAQAHEFLEKFQKSVGAKTHAEAVVLTPSSVRSLEYNTCDARGLLNLSGSTAVCCYHAEGQSMDNVPQIKLRTNASTDHIRPTPVA